MAEPQGGKHQHESSVAHIRAPTSLFRGTLSQTHMAQPSLLSLPPHALWRNGIKTVPQLLTTLKGNVINNLLTSAFSLQLLFLLLTGKSLLGKAPFAELAPILPAPAQPNVAFSQSKTVVFLMGARICRAGTQGLWGTFN